MILTGWMKLHSKGFIGVVVADHVSWFGFGKFVVIVHGRGRGTRNRRSTGSAIFVVVTTTKTIAGGIK